MARTAGLGGRGSRLVALGSVCLIAAVLYFGREVFIPLALALLLTFILTAPVQWLEWVRLPRIAAVLIVVAMALGLLCTIGYVTGRQFISVVDQLPAYQGQLRDKIQSIRSHGRIFSKLEHEARTIAGTTQPAAAQGQPTLQETPLHPTEEKPMPVRVVRQTSPLEALIQYAGSVFQPLVTAGLVVVLVIFMLYQREDLRDRMIRLVGHGRLNLTTQALDEAGSRISRYLGALALVNTLYGVCVAAGLWGIGHLFGKGNAFPNVLVWGLFVGLFRFVPYLGIWIGASGPLLLSFALFPGSGAFLATVGLFAVLELLVSQFIEPYWYGASTGMSALAVLIAAVVWTFLWGPIGLLMSTPLTVCLVVMGKFVPQMQFLDILLGDEPVLPPDVRVYQRLIASDEEEATEVARERYADSSLEEVYDQVLLPALAMAQQDHHRGVLEEERLAFVGQSMRDLVEELADEERAGRQREAASATEHLARHGSEKTKQVSAPSRAEQRPVKVLLLPAKSEADELAALMLQQLLEVDGYQALVAASTALAAEMLEMVQSNEGDLVCISAMPPAAVSHARYLCKRLSHRFPEVPILAGLWMTRGDLHKAQRRIGCGQEIPPVTSLAEARHQIEQLAQPILLRKSKVPTPEPVTAETS